MKHAKTSQDGLNSGELDGFYVPEQPGQLPEIVIS